ncbi:hypothetical protein CWC14_11790 [Pseudoalteromonas sp. S3260]|nr:MULTISPECIES: hypothetical protein [Pseudoalteromonas]KPH91286.1 hypothetical protein AMS57_08310 [Pseudoalteromonas undina]KYL37010.1 hypothetical protein A2I96_06835 [Pseudoalteromonas spiralis]MCK8128225.1 hypothetical protein [Pseudoalteromonas sp. 2CM39R]TMO95931.1 hypothetical protein CWC14_11790 [Pseudoalteromonas sp. S3260]TMS94581.1 hypothetical protein CWB58_03905 [Pseudoalteromonas sp. S201]
MLTLVLCLFMNSVVATLFCIALNTLAGIIVWRKIVAAQPQQGIILLEPNQFRFEGSGRQIQGVISKQSRLLGQSVWLYINGFSKNYWLIISANSVDEQSYARLKRATLEAINYVAESK